MLKKNRIKATDIDSTNKQQNSPSTFLENCQIVNNLRSLFLLLLQIVIIFFKSFEGICLLRAHQKSEPHNGRQSKEALFGFYYFFTILNISRFQPPPQRSEKLKKFKFQIVNCFFEIENLSSSL